MEYKIVKSWDGLDALQEQVQKYMGDGWQPSGGVAHVNYTGDIMWTQALVRETRDGGLSSFTETGMG